MKNKITIMKSRPDVTDQEIQSNMNFEALLQKSMELRTNRKRVVKNAALGLTTVGVVMMGLWFYNHREGRSPGKDSTLITQPKQHELTSEDGKVVKTFVDSLAALKRTIVDLEKQKRFDLPKSSEAKHSNKKTEKEVAADSIEKIVTQPVYVQAEPAEGYPMLYAYFSRSLTYPIEAMRDSVEGVVTVSFAINAQGKAEKISIDKSLGEAFDREAKRVIENMPLWKPATYDQKPVTSRMSLPLTFQIRKIKSKP